MVQSFNVSLIQKTPETRETGLLDQGRYYGAGLQKSATTKSSKEEQCISIWHSINPN